ncbi:MAG TPA: DUF3108 domain-containing protein, partial [Usitatibacter sp.]|nr:DUF3108 domain-containing protein [Usitatibacter sp.]
VSLPARNLRVPLLALGASAALHAAVVVGVPGLAQRPEAAETPTYAVTLLAPPAPAQPAAPPAPPPRAPRRARPRAPVVVGSDMLAALPAESMSDASGEAVSLQAPPEVIALAQPAAPVKALEAPAFPAQALPAAVAIEYQLTSAFAEGRATYRWEREGDNYRIRSEAHAEGFFTLFLEGQIVQESIGTVGPTGLRPERFSEQRPNAVEEGLTFDWATRTVTFERKGESRTGPLVENTVDWLSMIFQLAHVPPTQGVQELQVFTQRRMYRFKLQVMGVEEIEIPLGRVRALHVRHDDPAKSEAVDVWLGVDQHYLPVKMRYPVARNRLVVEQVATRVDFDGP